jgi:hypothetical protein
MTTEDEEFLTELYRNAVSQPHQAILPDMTDMTRYDPI